MKMTPQDFQKIKSEIEKIQSRKQAWDVALAQEKKGLVKDPVIAAMWSLLMSLPYDVTRLLYDYLSDAHIETALRKIHNSPEFTWN